MDIPTCNYKYLDNEFYVKSIKNDNYVPYVFGFIISISAIGLLINIYNANLEYKQELTNKIKIVLYIILILIFLGLLGYSGYKIGVYNTKDLTKNYSADELMRPCYSKFSKKIIGIPVGGMILQEAGLSFYSYNTRTSVNSDANSTSSLGTRVRIINNSAPPTSAIGSANIQQASQNSTGTIDERILGTIEDGGSLIVSGTA
jgi:hypothetical protein